MERENSSGERNGGEVAGWNHGSWFKITVSALAKCMECAGETGQRQLRWSCAEALGYFVGQVGFLVGPFVLFFIFC